MEYVVFYVGINTWKYFADFFVFYIKSCHGELLMGPKE